MVGGVRMEVAVGADNPQGPPRTRAEHWRAAAILFVHVAMFLLATPGLDSIGRREFVTERSRQEAIELAGPFWARVGFGIAWVNREVRLPVVDVLKKGERPFRIRQSWSLYRDGPDLVRRMEIHVDDELIYRSADPDHGWRRRQLSCRRVRPMVETTTIDTDSPNWEGLSRWVVSEARKDFPDVQRIELRSMQGPFPGTELRRHHYIEATAPDFTPTERRR